MAAKRKEILAGDKNNFLTVVREMPTERKLYAGKYRKIRTFECKCDCGRIVIKTLTHFFQNKSCGCKSAMLSREANTTHGLSKTTLFVVWSGILHRCYYKKAENYNTYGGAGVTVCDEWRTDFKKFYDWAIENGWKRGLQVDKDIKGNGLLYSPETCCIVTGKENMNKTSKTKYFIFNGQQVTLMDLSGKFNIPYNILYRRMKSGWDINDAVTKPIRKW